MQPKTTMNRSILTSFVAVILLALLSGCGDEISIVDPPPSDARAIGDRDSLSGDIKGTMKRGKTYYLVADVRVNAGDTLVIEPGAKLIDLTNHSVFISGSLLAHGTKDAMIYMGPDAARQFTGAWGGIQCDSPSIFSMKFCRMDYAAGVRPDGRPRPAIYYFSNAANTSKFYLEDCIVSKPKDDALLVFGGTGHVLRNYFPWNGEIVGSAVNLRTGFKGDVAYNYIWNCVDQAIRIETHPTSLYPQTDVNIYNNTIVSYGFRNMSRPGAGVIMDRFSRGNIYNNIFVNGRMGLWITQSADSVNIHYGNNLFYTTVDSLRGYFYPPTGVGRAQPSDQLQVDPMFVTFDADISATEDRNDVHVRGGSPIVGKGNPTYDLDIGAYTGRRP